MGRFEEFELPVRQIQDYPLVYEALIPQDCIFFQDIRRYQTSTANLDVKIIDVNGKIPLEQGMRHVPMSKLSPAEKKAFIEYLKVRVTRGDNIGSSWAFFRSDGKKKYLTAYGANIVYKDSSKGLARAKTLLKELSKGAGRSAMLLKAGKILLVTAAITAAGYWGYTKFIAGNALKIKEFAQSQSREMKFYHSIFPVLHGWLDSDKPSNKEIARAFLNPEYVTDAVSLMERDAYKEEDQNRGTRLATFIYFNYNREIPELIQRYRYRIQKTELFRLSRIYSCKESNYTSNVFYFKVGELDIKNTQITRYLNDNRVSYRDYQKIRDKNAFSDIIQEDAINFKLKGFLEDVYTFTPLRIDQTKKDINWYLLVRANGDGNFNFAAFFEAGQSTLVPKNVGAKLINQDRKSTAYSWYAIPPEQARELKLSTNSHVYFTDKMGQLPKLEVLTRKVKELKLEKIKNGLTVSIQRELLMEDSKGKFGIQCYDPITSLVLSNLISSSSFEEENKITLKRDPIQINTSLIQLSKDDSRSTQSINIIPGKTGIIELFRNQDSFKATLKNGSTVTFEKASINLFTPFSFMVYPDSITISYRHEIAGMTFKIGKTMLKISKSGDGGYEIHTLE